MYELPQNDLLSSDLEIEKILVKSKNWVPNFPSRNKNLAIELENWIKLATKFPWKTDDISQVHLLVSKYFVSDCRTRHWSPNSYKELW